MDNLKSSFEDVADRLERYLEILRGMEVGMTFAAIIRLCGQLANLPPRPRGRGGIAKERELNFKAQKLLADLSTHLHATNYRTEGRIGVLHPTSMRTSMIYDPGPQNRDGDGAR